MKSRSSDIGLILMITALVSAASLIAYALSIIAANAEYPRTLVSNILLALPVTVAEFCLVRSFIAHNKDATKSLIGFILSGLVMLSLLYAFSYLDPTKWYVNVKAALFLILAVFTMNQLLLASDHYGRPTVLFINQLLMVATVLVSVAAVAVDAMQSEQHTMIYISLLVFVLSAMFLVLTIEMKVNARKLQRRENGYVFEKSTTGEDILNEEDMFISNRYFYSLPWIVAVGLIALIAFNAIFDKAITWGYSMRYLFYVIKISALSSVIRMYRTHSKDTMKILLGFLLGMLLFENLCEVTFISTSAVTSLKSIVTMAMVLVNMFFVVIHLQLTKTHAGSPKITQLMKIAYAVYEVLALLTAVDCSIYYFMNKGANHVFFMFKPIMWLLGTFPVITGIVTIDTRINGFKLKRQQKQ